ncbi:MAG: hypothetical protein AB7T01_02625 [Acidithiobacillus sp.]
MAATERVVVLMSSEQKAQLQSRARAAHLSLADYVRRKALDEDATLEALLQELSASTAQARQALERTLTHLQAEREQRAKDIESLRAQLRAEYSQLNPEQLPSLLAPLHS